MENEELAPEEPEAEIAGLVDLEEHARNQGGKAPRARQYAFRVDKERIIVATPSISGLDILSKVGKRPEEFKLYQHKRGNQPMLVAPDQIVDLTEPGVERFTTMPRDTTEGRDSDPRPLREFRLPESDETYLEGLRLAWEARLDGASRWLIIHGWRVPSGYNHESVSLALLIPANYSDSQIDMVYFRPDLARTDGRKIGQLSEQLICADSWQRWSRHRTGSNPWRVGVDDIASHLALVDEWLRREFEKPA